MDVLQIEAELRVLFPSTHGEEFEQLVITFCTLKSGHRLRVQAISGRSIESVDRTLAEIRERAPFALFTGAMSPRHLFQTYPQAKTLIEQITGQKLPDQEKRPTTPAQLAPAPRQAGKVIHADPTACVEPGCTRGVNHAGRHYRPTGKSRKARQTHYADAPSVPTRELAPAPTVTHEPLPANSAALTTVTPTTPTPINQSLLPGLPDVQVVGHFKFEFKPEQTGQDDLYIVMGGRATVSRNRALAFMGDVIDGE